jgi:hypothetical protein
MKAPQSTREASSVPPDHGGSALPRGPTSSPSLAVAIAVAVVLALAAGMTMGYRPARGANPPPSPLVGTWLVGAGAKLISTCNGIATGTPPLTGETVAIRSGPGAELWYDIGCRCHLPLTISPTDAGQASLTTPTDCRFVFETIELFVNVEAVTIRLDPTAGTADVELRSGKSELPPIGTCESSVLTATLSPMTRTPAECGPDASAIGVTPYDPKGQRSCPAGAGREGLILISQDEDEESCSPLGTGASGQSFWSLPQTGKEDVRCGKSPSATGRQTHQHFCRIDGQAFRPLTTDPRATDQFYAVLKLSPDEAPCPNGSVEMVRTMDTEDDVNQGRTVGAIGPNYVGTMKGDTFTTLHFCFFRWAESAADTMAEFPDLGFPYAVFHDFDGSQPTWVNLKRYSYSRNETNTNGNRLVRYNADDALAVQQFREIVGDPTSATVFDLAWVR